MCDAECDSTARIIALKYYGSDLMMNNTMVGTANTLHMAKPLSVMGGVFVWTRTVAHGLGNLGRLFTRKVRKSHF